MRVVICADAHLDSSFPMFNRNDDKLSIRQEEQRAAFLKVIEEVKRIDAHMLLIPGDLFSLDKVSHKTIFFLKRVFASIKNTYVLITPGNNDPAVTGSPYLTQNWSENVYIFKNGLEALEFNFDDTNEAVRVYGVGFQNHSSSTSLLQKTPILDQEYINIFITHGKICEKGETTNYNPLYKADLDSCGFNLCALGHIHKNTGIVSLKNTNYIYPGPCEGRNFQETGTCGIYSGTINSDYIDLNFVPTSVRENISVDIDITSINNNNEAIDAIRQKCENKDYLYRVKLIGSPEAGNNISISKISAALTPDYFYIKIIPEYKEKIDINFLREENSLRGYYVRCMEEEYKQKNSDETELFYDALVYGLRSFEKEVLEDENS